MLGVLLTEGHPSVAIERIRHVLNNHDYITIASRKCTIQGASLVVVKLVSGIVIEPPTEVDGNLPLVTPLRQ